MKTKIGLILIALATIFAIPALSQQGVITQVVTPAIVAPTLTTTSSLHPRTRRFDPGRSL
jgi:hypothetical protein